MLAFPGNRGALPEWSLPQQERPSKNSTLNQSRHKPFIWLQVIHPVIGPALFDLQKLPIPLDLSSPWLESARSAVTGSFEMPSRT